MIKASDVKKLRDALYKIFVPFTQKIKNWQKQSLEIDKLRYYDESNFLKKEIVPRGDAKFLVQKSNVSFYLRKYIYFALSDNFWAMEAISCMDPVISSAAAATSSALAAVSSETDTTLTMVF